MKTKKWLASLLAVAMVLAMMPTMAFAATSTDCQGGNECTHAAKIENTHYDTLEEAISNVKEGETIVLLKDYTYTTNGEGLLDITVSCTLDGATHAINGYGKRGRNNTSLAINNSGNSAVEVTLKNLTINNNGASGRPIETRGNITSLTLENCKINATGNGNNQGLTIGGNQSTTAKIEITDTNINATAGGYPIIVFNPIDLTMSGGTMSGFCGIFFKGVDNSAGSRSSVANIEGTTFNCPNDYSGGSNSFGIFVFQDDGITVNLTDCNFDATSTGSEVESIFLFHSAAKRKEQLVNATISGKSVATGTILQNSWGTTPSLKVSGGQFSDREVVNYAENPVIQFGSTTTTGNNYFVGTAKEIEELVSSENIFAITVLKGDADLNNVPEGVQITNNGSGTVTANGVTVAHGETAEAHTWADEYTVDVAPTCTDSGEESRHCTAEGCTERMDIRVISPLGHTYNNDRWEYNEANHWKECTVCNTKDDSSEKAHTYGEWTVTKKASETAKGEKSRACTVCGYTETAEIPEIKIIEGDGGAWTQNTDGTLSFTANGDYDDFIGIKVDGNTVNEKYYDAVSGSTIITLKADYLKTLSAGEHKLTVLFNDGECSANFTVKAAQSTNPDGSPQTGDSSNLVLWFVLLGVSAAGLGAALLCGRKRRASR